MRKKEWPEDSKDEKRMIPAGHIGVFGNVVSCEVGRPALTGRRRKLRERGTGEQIEDVSHSRGAI